MPSKPVNRQKIAVTKVELVDPVTLVPYRDNPRRGDVEAIKESLLTNGQYRPLVVNRGDKASVQNEILAGNHTWLGVVDLGWNKVAVTFVNCTDEAAARIVLADNRTNDLASYSAEDLAKVLERVPNPVGTAYTSEDVAAILDAVRQNTKEAIEAVQETVRPTIPVATAESDSDPFDDVVRGSKPIDDSVASEGDIDTSEEEPEDEDGEPFNEADEHLGAMVLREDMSLKGKDYYGFPELRRNMLVDTMPQPIDTFAGKGCTPDDGTTTWLWNYGTSYGGLPTDRAILAFFADDERFENWYSQPAKYTAKAINNGFTMAVVPDFSFYRDDPLLMNMHNHYRGQWMGRFFQEAGLKVIPRVQFRDMVSLDFCCAGIPSNAPVIISSMQNDKTNGPGKPLTDEEKQTIECVEAIMEKLKPKNYILYGGPPGHRLVNDGHIKAPKGTTIHLMQSYTWKRRNRMFTNTDKQIWEK